MYIKFFLNLSENYRGLRIIMAHSYLLVLKSFFSDSGDNITNRYLLYHLGISNLILLILGLSKPEILHSWILQNKIIERKMTSKYEINQKMINIYSETKQKWTCGDENIWSGKWQSLSLPHIPPFKTCPSHPFAGQEISHHIVLSSTVLHSKPIWLQRKVPPCYSAICVSHPMDPLEGTMISL